MTSHYVIDTLDSLERRVTLTPENWDKHVAKRAELSGQLPYVRETMEDADIIVKHPDGSRRYYALGVSPDSPRLYVHVIVRFNRLASDGRVSTVWFSRIPEDGDLEWIRKKRRS